MHIADLNIKLIVLLFFMVYITSCNEIKRKPIKIDIANKIVEPNTYIVYFTDSKIVIDGKDNEEIWNKAPFTDCFIDIEGEKAPKYDTKVKMLWDNSYLYIYAKLIDKHIWATLKQRDTVIYHNNDFEIFIDPSNDRFNYAEIEINALGTIWDLKLDKPYNFSGKADNDWNLDNLLSRVYVNGTTNDFSDIDNYWSVELAIPIKAILNLKETNQVSPLEGEKWRVNFSRVQWDFELKNGRYQRKRIDNKLLPEYNWVWSNQKEVNMHIPERWGYIQFTKKDPLDNVKFIKDNQNVLNQILFSVYRDIIFGNLSYLKEKKKGLKVDFQIINYKIDSYKLEFKKTKQGFNLGIEDLNTEQKKMINQDGNLIKN